jgi:1,4-alpha-glucan branching enzyme
MRDNNKQSATKQTLPMTRQIKRKPVNASIPTTFRLYDPHAGEVGLAGDFNKWKPQRMSKCAEEDSSWEIVLELAPGEHQYKFVVDGNWKLDPACPITACTPLGTLNNVVEVKPA